MFALLACWSVDWLMRSAAAPMNEQNQKPENTRPTLRGLILLALEYPPADSLSVCPNGLRYGTLDGHVPERNAPGYTILNFHRC